MKTNYISRRNTTLRITTFCLLLVAGGVTATSEAKSKRPGVTNAFVRSSEQPARLIIRRLPTLGNNVVVDLFVDGAPFVSLTYGRTFDGALPAGRHVLSVQATPGPTYVTRTSFTLDAQSGETYSFTAEDDSGNLVLR